jgi:hypothetical protein
MHGFEDLSRVTPGSGNEAASPYTIADEHSFIADLTGDEIDRLVRRGRELRAAHLAAWGRQLFETWKSLFRRPGRVDQTPEVAAYRK